MNRMKSPFPGMDPYLEEHWGDVHSRLVVYASDQLQTQMPEGLRVRVEEGAAVMEEGEKARHYFPDVQVVKEPVGVYQAAAMESDVAVPLVISVALDPETERSIRIIDTMAGNKVVTAIEFLSLRNKLSEEGRQAYRRKQRDFIRGGVNLVEIDLLRSGRHILAFPEDLLPETHRTPYRILVFRAAQPDGREFYRAPLQERLPKIRVPLRPSDKDAHLDVQLLINQSYENGGYANDVDYRAEPAPPLASSDAKWADALLREKGLR